MVSSAFEFFLKRKHRVSKFWYPPGVLDLNTNKQHKLRLLRFHPTAAALACYKDAAEASTKAFVNVRRQHLETVGHGIIQNKLRNQSRKLFHTIDTLRDKQQPVARPLRNENGLSCMSQDEEIDVRKPSK